MLAGRDGSDGYGDTRDLCRVHYYRSLEWSVIVVGVHHHGPICVNDSWNDGDLFPDDDSFHDRKDHGCAGDSNDTRSCSYRRDDDDLVLIVNGLCDGRGVDADESIRLGDDGSSDHGWSDPLNDGNETDQNDEGCQTYLDSCCHCHYFLHRIHPANRCRR